MAQANYRNWNERKHHPPCRRRGFQREFRKYRGSGLKIFRPSRCPDLIFGQLRSQISTSFQARRKPCNSSRTLENFCWNVPMEEFGQANMVNITGVWYRFLAFLPLLETMNRCDLHDPLCLGLKSSLPALLVPSIGCCWVVLLIQLRRLVLCI